jgi:hypothetical protein
MAHLGALLTVTEAVEIFGVSRRTIFRKIKDSSISDTQIVRQDGETKIYVNELVRVFGEPKSAKNKQNQGVKDQEIVTPSDPRDAHIATLREQLKHERERADRYEREAVEQRHVAEALRQKLLEAPKPRRILDRLFGR